MGPPTGAAGRGASKSPKQSNKQSPPRQDSQPDTRRDAPLKPDDSTNAEPTKPLAPPPRPVQQQGSNSPDYFGNQAVASLSLEPNPFEQSFGTGGAPETPGGTKLPPVAALTSPSSLLPGNTPFAWGGGSLRTGPLSPAMLSGPTGDYFADSHHIRGSFPTPNESSLRTGLTPGGSGSMFPAPSPNSQALFAQLANSSATPGTVDFHRTALSAAAAKREQAQAQQQAASVAPTSQPQEMANGVKPVKPESKAPSGPFDPHDNDAANGLFMLAQGRNPPQPPAPVRQYPVNPPAQGPNRVAAAPAVQPVNTSPQMNGGASLTGSSVRGVSEVSAGSDESEEARPNTRARGKRNSTSKRKTEEPMAKPSASKKLKTNGGGPASFSDMDHSDDDDNGGGKEDGTGSKSKMTDEEKRKNFLERNRVAALKCRQRKKQWLANLQTKVEIFSTENETLNAQVSQLREEVVNLKTLLLAHKDCPITHQQGMQGAYLQQALEAFQQQPPPMHPYAMPAQIPGQAVMAGQADNRRYP
ncbi:Transcription factor [Collariella sp. IMI 366227]|nr:Transcription factor [Collariella sp. IMI 366227]